VHGLPHRRHGRQISEALPGAKVMAIQQVVKGRMETLAQFKKFSFGVSAIMILIGSLVVLVTMTGSVRERKAEIGVFRAIGFRKRHVMRIILMEATLISIGAGVSGTWPPWAPPGWP
jgi:putative ABC transport system permease protein